MNAALAVLKRELAGYFVTPVAYVFIVIFLFMTGVFTFNVGSFFERGQADLRTFFGFHPWLYLFLIPAISMRLWAEERRSGTIELLMTLPVPTWAAVVGKALAAWLFAGVALALTFPMWITVNHLGSPDNGVILAGYVGSFFMAGGFLSIGSMISALTRNQVIAFVLSVVVCFLFLISGYDPVLDFFEGWAPPFIVEAIATFSFLTHFESINAGVIDVRDVVFHLSLIGACLGANVIIVNMRRN